MTTPSREAQIRERCEKAGEGQQEYRAFQVNAHSDIGWLLDQLASARTITVVEVRGHEGKPVAAPCCLDGCQYDAARAAEGEKLAQLQNDVQRAMGFMNHVDSLAVYRLLEAALDRSKA